MSLAVSYSPDQGSQRTAREYVTAAGLLALDLRSALSPAHGAGAIYVPNTQPDSRAEDFSNFRQRVIGVPVLDTNGKEISYSKGQFVGVPPGNGNQPIAFCHTVLVRPTIKVMNHKMEECYRIRERVSSQSMTQNERRHLGSFVVPLSDGRQVHVLGVSVVQNDSRVGQHILVDPQTSVEYIGLVLVIGKTTSMISGLGRAGGALQVGFHNDLRSAEGQALVNIARSIPDPDKNFKYRYAVITDGLLYAALAQDVGGSGGWACITPHQRSQSEHLANVPAPRELLAYMCWHVMTEHRMLPPDPYRSTASNRVYTKM